MRAPRLTLAGLALLAVAGCVPPERPPELASLGLAAIAPAAGPDGDSGTPAATARAVRTATVLGERLLGGEAAANLAATTPADATAALEAPYPVDLGPAYAALLERERAAVERARRRLRLLERWQAARAGETPATTAEVRRAQEALRELGHYDGPIDGIEGPRTRRAVEAFRGEAEVDGPSRVTPGLILDLETAREADAS